MENIDFSYFSNRASFMGNPVLSSRSSSTFYKNAEHLHYQSLHTIYSYIGPDPYFLIIIKEYASYQSRILVAGRKGIVAYLTDLS